MIPCTSENETLGSKVCYHPCQKCDSIPDCPRATDEVGCPCRARLQSKFICDGIMDCQDYTDELGCGGKSHSKNFELIIIVRNLDLNHLQTRIRSLKLGFKGCNMFSQM